MGDAIFVFNRETNEKVICEGESSGQYQLWIATADVKDMCVETGGREMEPFLKRLAQLIERGVVVRFVHAKEPGPDFRKNFDHLSKI